MTNSLEVLTKRNATLQFDNELLRSRVKELEKNSFGAFNWPKTIIDTIPNPIFIKDESLSFFAVNTAFCQFLGMNESELIGKKDSDFFPVDQVEIFSAIDEEVLETGKPNWNQEKLTIDNSILNLLTSKVRINDSDENKFLFGLITDITDNKNERVQLSQKKNELELEKLNVQNLLKEVHHRVMNNLQVISSLLKLQRNVFKGNSAIAAEEVLEDCSHRILAMANVHETLYGNNNLSQLNFKPYIGKLIKSLVVSFGLEDQIEFNLELRSFYLNVNDAVPLGLAINEIITNAVRHTKNVATRIKIDIRIKKIKKQMHIEIEDNGGGTELDLSETSNSFGIELFHLFCSQIDAKVNIENKNNGLKFTIVLPS